MDKCINNIDNVEIGDKLEIHCYKHNGHLHRQWDEAVLLDVKEDYMVYKFSYFLFLQILQISLIFALK